MQSLFKKSFERNWKLGVSVRIMIFTFHAKARQELRLTEGLLAARCCTYPCRLIHMKPCGVGIAAPVPRETGEGPRSSGTCPAPQHA